MSKTTAPASRRASPATAPPVNRRRTFVVSVIGLLLTTGGLMVATVLLTHGTLTYYIDDTYIHLSMARTFAESGTWGVVPGDWQSADSSPGWILLLAGLIKIAAPLTEWLPFIINTLAAIGVLYVFANRQAVLVLHQGRNRPWRYLALLLLPSVLYLPGLIMLGMEHTLHTLLILCLLLCLERMLRGALQWRTVGLYCLLCLVATAIRFESAFMIVGGGLALTLPQFIDFVRRRQREGAQLLRRILAAAASGISAALPVCLMGWADLAHGAYFLPNSIIEKTALVGDKGVLSELLPNPSTIIDNFGLDWFLVVITVFGAVMWLRGCSLRPIWGAWLVGCVLHAAYAQFGWDDRYQAYLLIAGILLSLRTLPELLEQARTRGAEVARLSFVGAMVLLLVVLPINKYAYIVGAPLAATGQYMQQGQMARFLATYYDGKTVMVNDIGHVTWLHRGGLVDMWALATFDVLKAQRNGYYNASYMTTLAHENHVAVVAEYSPTFNFLVPHGYIKVGTWVLDDGTQQAAQSIQFWAPNEAAAQQMAINMHQFIRTIPHMPNLLQPKVDLEAAQ